MFATPVAMRRAASSRLLASLESREAKRIRRLRSFVRRGTPVSLMRSQNLVTQNRERQGSFAGIPRYIVKDVFEVCSTASGLNFMHCSVSPELNVRCSPRSVDRTLFRRSRYMTKSDNEYAGELR